MTEWNTDELIAADPPCISAAPAALDRYLAALPAMSLTPFAPFAKATAWFCAMRN
jgi:hypothetical protein